MWNLEHQFSTLYLGESHYNARGRKWESSQGASSERPQNKNPPQRVFVLWEEKEFMPSSSLQPSSFLPW